MKRGGDRGAGNTEDGLVVEWGNPRMDAGRRWRGEW